MQKQTIRIVLIVLAVISFIGSILVPGIHSDVSLSEAMKDAVVHEVEKIDLFGFIQVNPAVISAFIVSGILILFAIIVRIFVIPKFKRVPGKFQLLLEQAVTSFRNLAKDNSPHRHGFLGLYVFVAGVYIAFSTLFELSGIQVITGTGESISLPAPLSDLNGAISMAILSFLTILSGGIISNGIRGVGKTLKEFSLPISMSFRLFGALVSGLLVTDLVYHTIFLSYGIPVIVAILFTLLHAVIQAYVLTLLTSIFYGEVSEVSEKHLN